MANEKRRVAPAIAVLEALNDAEAALERLEPQGLREAIRSLITAARQRLHHRNGG